MSLSHAASCAYERRYSTGTGRRTTGTGRRQHQMAARVMEECGGGWERCSQCCAMAEARRSKALRGVPARTARAYLGRPSGACPDQPPHDRGIITPRAGTGPGDTVLHHGRGSWQYLMVQQVQRVVPVLPAAVLTVAGHTILQCTQLLRHHALNIMRLQRARQGHHERCHKLRYFL